MNTFHFKLKNKAKRAFTLIEIMVATVIMVVLTGLVIQITSEVLKIWARSSGKLSANAEARIAMDLITQDLETAVFRNNGQQWLRVEAPRDTQEGGASSYTDQTVSLRLFSPALDRPTGAGDICAIGYRLAEKKSYDGANAPVVYALYRRVIDPQATFNDYMGSGNSGPQLALTDATLWADFGANSITDDTNYLAGNIVEFKVLIYELVPGADPSIDPPIIDLVNADDDGQLISDYAYGGDSSSSGVSTNQLLYADVILTVVSDEGLELLRLLNEGRAGTGYEDDGSDTAEDKVVREHGETFTRRVNLMARPL